MSRPFHTSMSISDCQHRFRLSRPFHTVDIISDVQDISDLSGSCKLSPQFLALMCPRKVSHSVNTVPPVSRHWSCQSGKSNLRVRIMGDVQAGIRLRPVNSMHLARKKGSPRCAVKLSFKKFIKTVQNILQTTSSRKPSPLKINIWDFLYVPDAYPELILDFY